MTMAEKPDCTKPSSTVQESFNFNISERSMLSSTIWLVTLRVANSEDEAIMTISALPADLTNWSMTERSSCAVFKPRDATQVIQALSLAQAQGLSVIPHGAGLSYTDAALNTHGAVIDLTDMRRILAWDPQQGIMQVEPGVTLRDMIRVALPAGWWPPVAPSTAEATIGGCVAMNVTGKNAWKCGPFGEYVLSLSVLLATGRMLTLSPQGNPDLFYAVVGSAGLLGIITSITLQLRRITAGSVDVVVHPAASLDELFAIFQEEQSADFLEGLVDGFDHAGRGIVTCAKYSDVSDPMSLQFPVSRIPDQLTTSAAYWAGTLCRPFVKTGMRAANGMTYRWSTWWDKGKTRRRPLFQSIFYPPAAFTGYQAILPHGMESLQAVVPRAHAEALFKEILRRSHEHKLTPLWCVIKQHRPDPFLLSYQVDGFSLETYYQVVPQTLHALQKMLRELMDLVIAAGGRFYLAKDSLLTHALYCRSMGDARVEAFLQLKRRYDPDMLLQSNLFRRIFQEPQL
jgi:decaprenylphospho-beta-D-ribofuranose 2-oxidase